MIRKYENFVIAKCSPETLFLRYYQVVKKISLLLPIHTHDLISIMFLCSAIVTKGRLSLFIHKHELILTMFPPSSFFWQEEQLGNTDLSRRKKANYLYVSLMLLIFIFHIFVLMHIKKTLYQRVVTTSEKGCVGWTADAAIDIVSYICWGF